MNNEHHMRRMTKIGDSVTVTGPDGQSFTYVEDGRPCQVVALEDLLKGDEILGRYGEPFGFGTVDHVDKRVRQGPKHYWVIVMDDGGVSLPQTNPRSPRRIALRTS